MAFHAFPSARQLRVRLLGFDSQVCVQESEFGQAMTHYEGLLQFER